MGRRSDELRIEVGRVVNRIGKMVRSAGVAPTVRFLAGLAAEYIAYPRMRRRRALARVSFDGEELPYAYHLYSQTWRNERCLELAIAKHFLKDRPAGHMLEVGNVLGHFGVRGQDVIDKYERIQGVINRDVVDLGIEQHYDTILSISTLEHVRLDEVQQDPRGPLLALHSLRRALRRGGRLLVTVPIGYNKGLDEDIRSGRFSFSRQSYFTRISKENDWVEVAEEEALACSYGWPYEAANAVLVGIDEPEI